MSVARVLIGGTLAAAGLLGVILNLWVMSREIRGLSAPSSLPFFSGVVAAIGLAILPFSKALLLAPLPLLLDWGGCLQLIAPLVLPKARSTRR
jgi:hypothetical protein